MDYCVTCGKELPIKSGSKICKFCQLQAKYISMKCPECGAPLEVWAEYPIEVRNPPGDWSYEHYDLIRHCSSCGSDWQNEYICEFGDETETQLQRKFWG